MLKFISFGSGSSGNCYYLATATDALMIDIGVGIRSLKKHCRDYGVQLNSVRRLLITHDHADHIKSVGSFSYEYKVPVYATPLVHNGIDHNYCITRKVADEMKKNLEIGRPIQLGDFSVLPFAVPHDASENVGYEIQAGGVTFVIITDAGSVTDEMKERIARANYLVIEANHDVEMLKSGPYPEYLKKRILSSSGHLSNEDCGKALAENMSESLRHVWLCHLSEENNHPELARKTVETILKSYGIIPGKDMELEVLKRTVPTGAYELE
ncbi:MAG: MBL fold metallo-hydrolase [Prevotella sp.]|nr:MBL fold metallo-hydrolase [Prevotella sp.]